MYRELEKRFKDKGARIVIVDVEGNNQSGMNFVEKLGFKKSPNLYIVFKNHE